MQPTLERKVQLLQDSAQPLDLEDFLTGDGQRRGAFTRRLIEHLSQRGFFYLRHPTSLLEQHQVAARFEDYHSLYQEALLAHPYLRELLHAETVFQTGYNSTWFPESALFRQAIEAFMAKPEVWARFRKLNVPAPVRRLLQATEEVYQATHRVAFVLLEALELGYGLRRNSLRRLFRARREGAVRFVKYHPPCALLSRRRFVAHASEPHVDKSFFTFNLGESRPGLVWLEGQSSRLLPNGAGHWLVTSGLFSQGLTRHLERPVVPFSHTVLNDGERIVILGFVTPEGDLHNVPLEEWPVLPRQAAPRSARA
jgi:isopenicillin N synthase-like dioxygenase